MTFNSFLDMADSYAAAAQTWCNHYYGEHFTCEGCPMEGAGCLHNISNFLYSIRKRNWAISFVDCFNENEQLKAENEKLREEKTVSLNFNKPRFTREVLANLEMKIALEQSRDFLKGE